MRIDKHSGIFNCLSCGHSGNIFSVYNEQNNVINSKIEQLKNRIDRLRSKSLTLPIDSIPWNKEFRNISIETYTHFGAFTSDKNFPDRIVFPIYNHLDEIVYFHARYTHTKLSPKYINYPKNIEKQFYPLYPKLVDNSIILVEGFFDLLNLYDKGITNTVCTFGSSLVSKNDIHNIKLFKKFTNYKLQGVNTIYIMFDSDEAGIKSARKLKSILSKNYKTEIIYLEEGVDPGMLSRTDIQNIKRDYYA